MKLTDKIEENADLVLWCVHVLGMDDVHAAPNHGAAVVGAREMNKALFSQLSNANDFLCFCYAAPWPHSDDDHTEDLKEWVNFFAPEIKTKPKETP